MKYTLIVVVTFLFLTLAPTAYSRPMAELKTGAAIWSLMDDADRSAIHIAYTLRPLDEHYGVRPTILMIWADEGQRYFAAGLAKDLYENGPWSVRFSFHAGLMDSAEELGDTMEFYSALSGRYHLDSDWAIEAEVGHISNGGLGDTNPGSESFVVSVIKSF